MIKIAVFFLTFALVAVRCAGAQGASAVANPFSDPGLALSQPAASALSPTAPEVLPPPLSPPPLLSSSGGGLSVDSIDKLRVLYVIGGDAMLGVKNDGGNYSATYLVANNMRVHVLGRWFVAEVGKNRVSLYNDRGAAVAIGAKNKARKGGKDELAWSAGVGVEDGDVNANPVQSKPPQSVGRAVPSVSSSSR